MNTTLINKSSIKSVVLVADGGCKGNGKEDAVAYGSFACLVNGEVVHRETFAVSGEQTNNVAEWSALIRAIEYMASDPRRAKLAYEVHMDSQLVITQVNGQAKVKAAHIKDLYEKFLSVIGKTGLDGYITKFVKVPRAEIVAVLGH